MRCQVNQEKMGRKEIRNKRQIETDQSIYLPRKTWSESLMLGLMKEFANLQKVSQMTACLTIPRTVSESIP